MFTFGCGLILKWDKNISIGFNKQNKKIVLWMMPSMIQDDFIVNVKHCIFFSNK